MTRLLPLWLALAGAPAPTDGGTRWRVVVQDSLLVPGAATQDRSLVAGALGAGSHVLQVVEARTPRVLLTLPLPDPITSVAFAPDKKRLAVATRQGVWLITLADNRAEELLQGVSGLVTFNADGNLLGVLGHIGEGKGSDKQPVFGRPAMLGIYDLKEKRWRARCASPIMIQPTVVFEGETLMGYGLGGRVFHRAASSFPCDVRLNAKTGAAKESRGVEKPRRGGPGNKPGGDNYQVPRSITQEQKRLAEVKKVGSFIQEKLSSTGGRELRSAHFAGLALKDRVLFAVHRFAGRPCLAAALSVRRDGTIELGPAVEAYNGAWPTSGTLACATWADAKIPFVDLLTGKTLFEVPRDRNKQGASQMLLATGALVNHGGKLSFYKAGKALPVWTREQAELGVHTTRLSADGRSLAVYYPKGKVLVRILRTDSGKQLTELARPQGVTENYAYSMSFDPAGRRFAVLIGRRLLIHEATTGKLLVDEELRRQDAAMYVCGLKDGWLVCGFARSRLFEGKKGWTRELPVGDVNHAEEIDSPAGRRLLLETKYGHVCLADLNSGRILSRWVGGAYHSAALSRERPADAVAAFDGTLLVRSLGWAGAVELVNLRGLKTVLTIHPVPVGDKLGWVAFTPDGQWDASPGAERFVQVFQGDKPQDERARAARRNGASIRDRLKAVCRGE